MSTMPTLKGPKAEDWIRRQARPGPDQEARDVVAPILADVRQRGDAAVREHAERLDEVSITSFHARAEDRRRALAGLTAARRTALETARSNIEAFHRAQLRSEPRTEVRPGVTAWREFRPLEQVGLYIPGGRAGYPSSVLMSVIPARLAGCPTIIVCVPPGPEGVAPEPVLAAAELLDVDAVFAIGGAQAIGAMAYGTESVPRVDKIFGPGNRYVTAAKELVHGAVHIDMPAGPSEIVVLADDSANPRWVAADLISQAEHAPDAVAVLVTPHDGLAERVAGEIDEQLESLPTARIAAASLADSAICVAPDGEAAVAWVNLLAPEHLSVVTRDDESAVDTITHAGSITLGPWSPVAAGDYAVGTNHILPTSRRARAWSALSVDDFGRWIQIQRLTADGLAGLVDTVTELARWEGFEAHARAVEIRFEDGG